MTIHLNTQADLDAAIQALVRQDKRLKPILTIAGMPALRRREPGFTGLSAMYLGIAQVLNESYGRVVLPIGPRK